MEKNSLRASTFKKPYPIDKNPILTTPINNGESSSSTTPEDARRSIPKDDIGSLSVSRNTRSATKKRESSEFSFGGDDDSFELFTDSQLLKLDPLLDNEDANSIETDGGSIETDGGDILDLNPEEESSMEEKLNELAQHEQDSKHLELSNPKFDLPKGVVESYKAGIRSRII
jgi:hypothetical protein